MSQSNTQDPPTREIASARKNISELDKQLANSAFIHFKSKNYEQCLQQLVRLLELRPHDARVSANKALVEYYDTKLTKTDEFVKQISAAKKQLEFGMINTGDELDDIDRSFLLYNQAVIYFYTKRYQAAINVLERLFKVIEPLGDVLALKVCVLLVEVYLLSNQLDQAYGMILHIENTVLGAKIQHHEGEQNHHAKMLVSMFKPKLQMFKVRVYMMKGFYGQSKRELKLAMNSSNNSTEALFIKSNVECLRLNFQKSIKLLNSASKANDVMQTGHPLGVLYYSNMAAVHFAMKKYNLAAMYGMKAVEENYAVMKSLPPIEKFNHLSGRPLPTLALNRRAELYYDLGLSLLYSNNPAKAFDCLIEVRKAFQCNPRYWLRLAECCIGADKQAIEKNERSKNKKSEYVRGVVGAGAHRKIVLAPPPQHNRKIRQNNESAAIPSATLEFASICLTNAMLLLPIESVLESNMTMYLRYGKAITGEDEKELIKRSPAGRLNVMAPPGAPIQTKEAYRLRASTLCCQAYVSLCLGDYYKSLEYSKSLQRMAHISAHRRFLSYIYLTESLIKLDRVTEAAQQISPDKLKSLSTFEEDITDEHKSKEFPKNIIDVRTAFMLNLASIYCISGDYEKSKQLLRQVTSSDLSLEYKPNAVLLSVFCDLKMGKISSALSLIKRNEVFSWGRLIDRVDARLQHISLNQAPQINPLPPARPTPLPSFQHNSGLPPGGIPYPSPASILNQNPINNNGTFSSSAYNLVGSQNFSSLGSDPSSFQRLGLG